MIPIKGIIQLFPPFQFAQTATTSDAMLNLLIQFIIEMVRAVLVDVMSSHVRSQIVRLWKAARARDKDRQA
jgi:hypothetical protein